MADQPQAAATRKRRATTAPTGERRVTRAATMVSAEQGSTSEEEMAAIPSGLVGELWEASNSPEANSVRKSLLRERVELLVSSDPVYSDLRESDKEPTPVEKALALERASIANPPDLLRFGETVNQLISKMYNFPDRACVKEVEQLFLWELLRNSVSALFGLRCEAVVDVERHGADMGGELCIRIVPDEINDSLSIIDNGIGMEKHELQKYLCDNPRRKLEEYMENLKTLDTPKTVNCSLNDYGYNARNHFCGLFWNNQRVCLGFHSVYMVADKVVVTTKTSKGKQWVWSWEVDFLLPNGGYYYTLAEDTSGETDLGRGGTKVTLFLNTKYCHFTETNLLYPLIEACAKNFVYPIYISSMVFNDLRHQEGEGLESFKSKFEGLRRLFEEVLKFRVEEVVLSDRVYDLANHLSPDRKTFYINPRSPITEQMRQRFEAVDPFDHMSMIDMVKRHFMGRILNITAYDMKYNTNLYNRPDLDKAVGRFPADWKGFDMEVSRARRKSLMDKYANNELTAFELERD